MTKEEYELRRDELFRRWLEARPYYDDEGKEFTYDGISDFQEWINQKPQILFLLKEAWQGYHPYFPNQKVYGKFGVNIARWKLAIKEIYAYPEIFPNFMEAWQRPKYNNDIAIVEVKKVNEELSRSNNNTINSYAMQDSAFLREQIDLINPLVVVCCGTSTAYGDFIYGDDEWKMIYSIQEPKPCACFNHNNRLVIDFYHPTLIATSPRMMFDLLCRLLIDGKVFANFDW